VMHDRDGDLLRIAAANPPRAAGDGSPVTVETRRSDITRLRPADLTGAHLITASALLDLMTRDELAAMIDACAAAGCPVMLTLSVVGSVELLPAEPLDARVAAAFDGHQRRMTIAGRLLGPDAVAAAIEGFHRHGAEVLVRPSPWRLRAAETALATEWFSGWAGAAFEQDGDLAAEAGGYVSRRMAQARAGQLAVDVHHADLLVLP